MNRDLRDLAGAAGLGLVMVACCAGPTLLVAGALGVIAGVARNPYVIAAAAGLVALLIVVAVAGLRRHRRRGDGAACCPPGRISAAHPSDQLPVHNGVHNGRAGQDGRIERDRPHKRRGMR